MHWHEHHTILALYRFDRHVRVCDQHDTAHRNRKMKTLEMHGLFFFVCLRVNCSNSYVTMCHAVKNFLRTDNGKYWWRPYARMALAHCSASGGVSEISVCSVCRLQYESAYTRCMRMLLQCGEKEIIVYTLRRMLRTWIGGEMYWSMCESYVRKMKNGCWLTWRIFGIVLVFMQKDIGFGEYNIAIMEFSWLVKWIEKFKNVWNI